VACGKADVRKLTGFVTVQVRANIDHCEHHWPHAQFYHHVT
jgi:hypothetical protein